MLANRPEFALTLAIAEHDRPVALVVEDDPFTRNQLAELLRRAGWSVREARDGESGLLLARECVPDVILLDLALPRTSGLDVLRTIKAWTDQRAKVIVVSFYAMMLQHADLKLADATVQKPFQPDDVLSTVERFAPALT
jgi:CheY-like chemotaxis protein